MPRRVFPEGVRSWQPTDGFKILLGGSRPLDAS